MKHLNGLRLATAGILAVALASLPGCLGVYAEVGGFASPSAKYTTDDSDPSTALAESAVKKPYYLGFGFGMEFDWHRKTRLAWGYGGGSMQVGEGTEVKDNVTAFARLDFRIRKLGPANGLGIGVGADMIQGSLSGVSATNAPIVDESTQTSNLYAGLLYYHWLSKRLGVRALLGGGLASNELPGGTVAGPAIEGKLTVSYVFGDTAESEGSSFGFPFETETNLMPNIAAAATAIGCRATDGFHDTFAVASARCPGGDVTFVQTTKVILVHCPKLSESKCRQLAGSITEEGARQEKANNSSAPSSSSVPASTAPAPATTAPASATMPPASTTPAASNKTAAESSSAPTPGGTTPPNPSQPDLNQPAGTSAPGTP